MSNYNTQAPATQIQPNVALNTQQNGKRPTANGVDSNSRQSNFKSSESDYLKTLRELASNSCETKGTIYDCLNTALDSFLEVSYSILQSFMICSNTLYSMTKP